MKKNIVNILIPHGALLVKKIHPEGVLEVKPMSPAEGDVKK